MAAVDDNWKKKEKEVWTVEGILPLRRCDAGDGQQVIGFVQFFWRPSADSYPPFLCSLVLCWTQKEEEEDNALNILSGYLVAARARLTAATAEPGQATHQRTCHLGQTGRERAGPRRVFLSFFLLFCFSAFIQYKTLTVCVCVSHKQLSRSWQSAQSSRKQKEIDIIIIT
jgi:hypothetical protein